MSRQRRRVVGRYSITSSGSSEPASIRTPKNWTMCGWWSCPSSSHSAANLRREESAPMLNAPYSNVQKNMGLHDLTSAACRLSTRARRSRTTLHGAFPRASQPAELQLLDDRVGSVPDDSARVAHALEVEATKRRRASHFFSVQTRPVSQVRISITFDLTLTQARGVALRWSLSESELRGGGSRRSGEDGRPHWRLPVSHATGGRGGGELEPARRVS